MKKLKLVAAFLDGLDGELLFKNLNNFTYLSGLTDKSRYGILHSEDPYTRAAMYSFYTGIKQSIHKRGFKYQIKFDKYADIVDSTIFDSLNENKITFGLLSMPLLQGIKGAEFFVDGWPTFNRYNGNPNEMFIPKKLLKIVGPMSYPFSFMGDQERLENVSDEEIKQELVPYDISKVDFGKLILDEFNVDILFIGFRWPDDFSHLIEAQYDGVDSEGYCNQLVRIYKKYVDQTFKKVMSVKSTNYLFFSDHGRYLKPMFDHHKSGFYLTYGKDIISKRKDMRIENLGKELLEIVGL